MQTIDITCKAWVWSFDGDDQSCTAKLPGGGEFDFVLSRGEYAQQDEHPYELRFGEGDPFDIVISIPATLKVKER